MASLDELAKQVDGTLLQPSTLEITGTASIPFAQKNDLTFVTNETYLKAFEASEAGAAVTPLGLQSSVKPCIQVADAEVAFAQIVALFRPPVQRPKVGISPQATVAPTAKIAEDVCIYPGAVIMDHVEIGCGSVIFPNVTLMENCCIGSHVKIFPGAVLYENTIVGDRSIIHAGVVLGAYGFGYTPVDGSHRLTAQLGNVKIESDVEIGANSAIDRGSYDSTTIQTGTKIDDLVMIGHNCQIGKHNLFCSQVGIAGSCKTGDSVVMGGQVGLADHIEIGDQVAIGAQSGVMANIEPNAKMFGSPARPARQEMQLVALRAKLPQMRKTIRHLENEIETLKKQIALQSQSPEPLSGNRRDAA